MKKWTLILCLLFSCATIFVACGKGGNSTGTGSGDVSTESDIGSSNDDVEMPPIPLP